MTRINLVDPQELYDQHLIAERREIRLLCANFERSKRSKNGIQTTRIPKKFTLNSGHCLFFYNKGQYLHKRFEALTQEMINRGFQPDTSLHFPQDIWPSHLYNDWAPTEEDKAIVRERINLRLSQRPGWYRKTPS
jgi:deoxyribonuclease (pyrimidine dimer)